MLFVDTGTPDVRENQGAPFLFSRSVMMQVYFFHQVVWRWSRACACDCARYDSWRPAFLPRCAARKLFPCTGSEHGGCLSPWIPDPYALMVKQAYAHIFPDGGCAAFLAFFFNERFHHVKRNHFAVQRHVCIVWLCVGTIRYRWRNAFRWDIEHGSDIQRAFRSEDKSTFHRVFLYQHRMI